MRKQTKSKDVALVLRLLLAALLCLQMLVLTSCLYPYEPPVSGSGQEEPAPPVELPEGTLEVTYLDVGEASAALVSSEGHHMLIDGGNVGDSSLLYSVLKARGITHLDYIVFSHVDEDHVGGLAGALNYATVDTCYGSSDEHDTKAFGNFKKYLGEQGVSITVPEGTISFDLGSAAVMVWHVGNGSEANSNELVVRIENGSDSFLFTGDIDSGIEHSLVEELGAGLQSDVLLVPHHGSDTSSSYVFLGEVNPAYSVLSVGDNSYGHPSRDVLSRYRDLGTTLLRSDLHGNITFTSDSESLHYETGKSSDEDVFAP